MKKVLFVFAVVAASFAADAQTVFGLKAGVNAANLKFKMGSTSLSYDTKIGAHVGGFANTPVSTNFRFQPEVLFSMEGAKFEGASLNLNYINVPLMFQYAASGFHGETGPQVGFLMSAKGEEDGVSEDVKESFKSTAFSWGVGAGYTLANGLGFNARYNFGLSNIGEAEDDEDDFSIKSNVFQFGLSFALGGASKASK